MKTKSEPSTCPECGAKVVVETRGPESWVARCTAGYLGCEVAFGDSIEEALRNFEELFI